MGHTKSMRIKECINVCYITINRKKKPKNKNHKSKSITLLTNCFGKPPFLGTIDQKGFYKQRKVELSQK